MELGSEAIQLAFARESMAKLTDLVEKDLKKLPPRPSRLQLVDHAELCAIVHLFGEAKRTSEEFQEMFKKYALAVEDVRTMLNDNKSKRADIIARLDKLNKDVGLA